MLDLGADLVLDLSDPAAKYLVHCAVAVGRVHSLDLLDEPAVHVGDDPEADLDVECAWPPARKKVLGGNPAR